MRKLSEIKDEEALDLLADILEPVINIFGDKDIAKVYKNGEKLKAVQLAIKNHKSDVIILLATLEGVPVDEYHCNIFTLPKTLLEIFNDPELTGFFESQSQTDSEATSGSVTENTEVEENTL